MLNQKGFTEKQETRPKIYTKQRKPSRMLRVLHNRTVKSKCAKNGRIGQNFEKLNLDL